ncbi:hypothetical protein [Nitrosomonas communis]|uniref:hypothetical protein n=1 Tax=Nitrosomonas communis TaxID=44574 RepID=UPI003D28DCC1
MHTINHPVAEAIVGLGKMIAKRLRPDLSIERNIVISDGLTSLIWPVYPEVGMELGLEGGYRFRIGGTEIEGVRSYLEFIYKKYVEQGINPGDLASLNKIPKIDNILTAELKCI